MFCSNCGKEIRQGANFCMYCGAPVGDIENGSDEGKTEWTSYEATGKENYCEDEYSNCENGIVSFPKMFRNFFSKDIKHFFMFEGSDSRLEHFYTKLIIYISLITIALPFAVFPPLYFVIAVPLTVSFFWLMLASTCRRLNDLGCEKWKFFLTIGGGLLLTPIGIGFVIILCIHAALYLQQGKSEEEQNKTIVYDTYKKVKNENIKKSIINIFLISILMVAILICIGGIIFYFADKYNL